MESNTKETSKSNTTFEEKGTFRPSCRGYEEALCIAFDSRRP